MIGVSIAVCVILAFFTVFIFLTDFDGDGLKNLDEISIGTGVFNPDTDGDGLSDGLEVNYGTKPLMMDSDNDGLDDGTEVLGSWHMFELKSITWNTYYYSWALVHEILDETGNYLEYYSWRGHSWTWPYDRENILMRSDSYIYPTCITSDPLSIDTDDDGLNDKKEYEIGTNPRSNDTDNDGLDDMAEFMTYKTIPLFYDTDGDLLSDVEEISTYKTDPLNWDSDNDHLSDGIEVKGYDVDGDDIIDVDFPTYGANPLVTDIFVEVDWTPPGNRLGSGEKSKLIEMFGEHNMVLHIDDGELGGGAETQESVEILYDNRDGPMNDFYDFMEKYFTPKRRGTFYWCLTTTQRVYLGGEEVGGYNAGSIFVVGRAALNPGPAFMHELGHALGLSENDFDGIDSEKYSFIEYRSVMNYNSPPDFYGYSDGPLFDDWAHLDFKCLAGRYTQ